MALPIKICMAAILCCTIAFARADSDKALQPSEWERSKLSETIDPAVENDIVFESSEYDQPENTIDDDYAENNSKEASEPDSIDDEDFDGERVKRQLQLPQARQKIYKYLIGQRLKHRPRYIRKHFSRKVRSIDNLDTDVKETPEVDWTEDNSGDYIDDANAEGDDEDLGPFRVKRQIRIPRPEFTFPKTADTNKFPFPNVRRTPDVYKGKYIHKNRENDFPEENAEDELPEEIPENDLPEENAEEDLPEEDYQTQEEDENVDSTRVKRQIIFPRPTPTFPYPKGPFTYPNLPRRPYPRTRRSAEDVSPLGEIVCTPPFVPCNPAHKNCRPFGLCRPPPYLPQYPQWPRY